MPSDASPPSPPPAASPPSGDNSRVALRTLRPLAGHLRAVGHDAGQLLAELGIDPSGLLDPGASIPHPRMLEVWRRAEARTGDPDLGLHVLERLEIQLLERVPHETEWVVLQMFVLSPTVEEAIARYARYFPVTFYGSEIAVDREHDLVHVRHRVIGDPPLPRSFAEFILGMLARLVHEIASVPVTPRELRFAHPAPASVAEAARVLPLTPRYAAGECAVSIAVADLAVPMRAPNPALLAGLDRHGDELLARLPPLGSFVDQARALIAAELAGGNPNAEHLADALKVSVRTLSRRLSDHGTSHKALLDEVRASLSRRYLVDERRAVHEVASLLGFSEVSAFHRAFRRWFGRSPSEFRRDHEAAE